MYFCCWMQENVLDETNNLSNIVNFTCWMKCQTCLSCPLNRFFLCEEKLMKKKNTILTLPLLYYYSRSSRAQILFKIAALKNLANFIGKQLLWSLFLIKFQAKKRLQHKCFPVKYAKFLRTSSLQNTSGGCFYYSYIVIIASVTITRFFEKYIF